MSCNETLAPEGSAGTDSGDSGFRANNPDDTSSEEAVAKPIKRKASADKAVPKAKRQLMSHGVAMQMKVKQPMVDAIERLAQGRQAANEAMAVWNISCFEWSLSVHWFCALWLLRYE
jgi:hypothetical protein